MPHENIPNILDLGAISKATCICTCTCNSTFVLSFSSLVLQRRRSWKTYNLVQKLGRIAKTISQNEEINFKNSSQRGPNSSNSIFSQMLYHLRYGDVIALRFLGLLHCYCCKTLVFHHVNFERTDFKSASRNYT